MKKLIYAGLACFMLLAVQACSGNTQKSILTKLAKKLSLKQLQTLYMTKSYS